MSPPTDETALRYHQATNHSLASVRSNQHRLVWSNLPRPYKLYVGLDGVTLPPRAPSDTVPALEALTGAEASGLPPTPLDLPRLASVLHYSAGIMRTLKFSGGEMSFRAAACTGALYHIELYLVCGDLAELDSGVYHFGAHDGQLRHIRLGDYRGALAHAMGAGAEPLGWTCALIYTTTYWRNSWKYQARAYRHAFWDEGTMLANTLAVAAAQNIPAALRLGFVDDQVSQLIAVDDTRELAIGIVTLGGEGATPPPVQAPERLSPAIVPSSAHEIPEPLILEAHRSGKLNSAEQLEAWRAARPAPVSEVGDGHRISLHAPLLESPSIEQIIERRGSARRFQRTSITLDQLSSILRAATGGIQGDVYHSHGFTTASLYLIVNAVDGLAPGTYVYQPREEALQQLRVGEFRDDAGYLDLGQELAADAAVNCYVLADLHGVVGRLGDRGYRVAQTEGGIIGGRLYLASYAVGLSATGLTFFDEDVISFFSPHAAGKSVMFLTAIGHKAPRFAQPPA